MKRLKSFSRVVVAVGGEMSLRRAAAKECGVIRSRCGEIGMGSDDEARLSGRGTLVKLKS